MEGTPVCWIHLQSPACTSLSDSASNLQVVRQALLQLPECALVIPSCLFAWRRHAMMMYPRSCGWQREPVVTSCRQNAAAGRTGLRCCPPGRADGCHTNGCFGRSSANCPASEGSGAATRSARRRAAQQHGILAVPRRGPGQPHDQKQLIRGGHADRENLVSGNAYIPWHRAGASTAQQLHEC